MVNSVKGLISGAEDLLRSTASITGDGVESARGNVRHWLDGARGLMADLQGTTAERYRQTTGRHEPRAHATLAIPGGGGGCRRDHRIPRRTALSARARRRRCEARPSPSSEVFDTCRGLLLGAVIHLRTRLRLLGLEVRREQQRLVGLLAAAMLWWMLTGITLLLFALTVILVFWATPWRLHAMATTLAAFTVASVVARSAVLRRLNEEPALFAASLAELDKDEAALGGVPSAGEGAPDGPVPRTAPVTGGAPASQA
jgi:uncharacterized membrane protein YqjE